MIRALFFFLGRVLGVSYILTHDLRCDKCPLYASLYLHSLQQEDTSRNRHAKAVALIISPHALQNIFIRFIIAGYSDGYTYVVGSH